MRNACKFNDFINHRLHTRTFTLTNPCCTIPSPYSPYMNRYSQNNNVVALRFSYHSNEKAV